MRKVLLLALLGTAAACAAAGDDSGPAGSGGVGGSVNTCVPEICGDGLDNDCDGSADENCPCQLGDEQECYTGPSNTVDQGLCRRGTQQCAANGTWGHCDGDIVPSVELCDNLDNDCDGVVDNSCTVGTGGAGGMYARSNPAGADYFDFDETRVPFRVDDGRPVTFQVDFTWRYVASRPPPYDLAVRIDGLAGSLVQVFSVDSRPFARIGTRVEPLEPDASYRIEVVRDGVSVVAHVVSLRDEAIILRGPARELLVSSSDTVTLVAPSSSPRVRLGDMHTVRVEAAE